MVTQKKKGGNYYYKFMNQGKLYCGICEGCATQREAEAYEQQIRKNVSAIVEKQSTATMVNTFRKTIENIGDEIGQLNQEDRADARAAVELLRDRLTEDAIIPIAAAFDEYLKQPPKKRKAGEHQTARNRSYWGDFIAFMQSRFPDAVNLADVTTKHAKEYIYLLNTSGAFCKEINYARDGKSLTYQSKAEQLSPRTINARHKAIKAVFARLADDAGLTKNPFDLPTLNNDTVNREVFTYEEMRLIGDNMSMPFTRPIFTIGLCTGLTLGDICLLRWREVSGKWINRERMKTKVHLEIPILPPLAAFLAEQRPRTGDQEFVCPDLAAMYQGNPSGVFGRIKKFLEGIGISTTTKIEGRTRAVSTKAAHAMRHTFAYLAGVYGVPQSIVQSVLGHLTPRMTELYQQHAQREQKEKFFRQMPNVLGAPAEPLMIEAATTNPAEPLMIEAATTNPAAIADGEPERERLHRLADQLDIEIVREIVKKYGRDER